MFQQLFQHSSNIGNLFHNCNRISCIFCQFAQLYLFVSVLYLKILKDNLSRYNDRSKTKGRSGRETF